MGKKKGKHSAPKDDLDLEEKEGVDPTDEDFFYDEVDKFHMKRAAAFDPVESDSDEYSDKEEGVYDINLKSDGSDNEDLDEEDFDDDDDELQSDDDDGYQGIPSSKAWGKSKQNFYGHDKIDDKLQGHDRDVIQDEEEAEALKIQQRLAQEIDEELLQFTAPKEDSDKEEAAQEEEDLSKVEIDVTSLSVKAQWKLVKRESPELKALIADFKEMSKTVMTVLQPLMDKVKAGGVNPTTATFIQLRYNLYLTYLMNISLYMALKTKRVPVHNHPVVKRLAEFRTLINNIPEEDFEKVIADVKEMPTLPSADTTTKTSVNTASSGTKTDLSMRERLKLLTANEGVTAMEEDEEEDDRRAAGYDINKNKGYVKKSKKTNPRVRHKERYRRAKIRRKGAQRTYNIDVAQKKYAGELSGIRAGVVKSVKLK